MSILDKYLKLKTREDKRRFCISIDIENKYSDILSFKQLSLFSINVLFSRLTELHVEQDLKTRNTKHKEHKTF
jgi:hypothetical protein